MTILRPIAGLEPLVFSGHSSLPYLAPEAHRLEGPNIGRKGEHLTILFLAHNRTELSERLCRSIERHLVDFKGTILAVDNGSRPDEAEQLRDFLSALPLRTRILKLDRNYGVAAGRNKGVVAADTDWIISLDNDIFFTRNPLPKIQADMARMGTKFANLPLLQPDGRTSYSFGGVLSVWLDQEGQLRIGHGSAYLPADIADTDRAPELSTFLFGGASVFERSEFLRLGGFDENMFVGFEDTDFSMRLLHAGLKVGTIGTFSLIHDHPTGEDELEDYKKTRFSYREIEHSARYMENKYGFSFWNDDLKAWLALKDANEENTQPISARPKDRPRIALMVDSDNWAFANISRQLLGYLTSEFDMTMVPYPLVDDDFRMLLSIGQFDLAHFFWREHLFNLKSDHARARARRLGLDIDIMFEKLHYNTKITFSVFDHLFLEPTDVDRYRWIFNAADGYSVCSDKLARIYTKLPQYPAPKALTPDGVDLELFSPQNPDRFSGSAAALRVGWAGNSRWGIGGPLEESKGLRTILRPALEILRDKGIDTVEVFADRGERFRKHEEMPEYYASVDVYVCASAYEGTPNPVLEAMACGVPIISTNVGIVSEVLGPIQSNFIVDRSPEAFAAAIASLHQERSLLARLSQENLIRIKDWSWEAKAINYRNFFREALRVTRS